MSIKISELTQTSSIGANDVLPLVQSGTTKKVTTTTLLSEAEKTSNKTTSISSSSTDTQYPSAKAVYDYGQTLGGGDNYSTTEQVVGTWINGKPLYQIVVQCAMPQCVTNGTNVTTQTRYDTLGLSNLETKIPVVAFLLSSSNTIPLMYASGAGYQAKYSFTGTHIEVVNGATGNNNMTPYVIFRYTKTTDTATRSLNTASLMNTGSLVGLGNTANLDVIDRAELDVEDKTKLDTEELQAVDNTEETEGSGDTI